MKLIKKEWALFLTALMFFTRIPIPFRLAYSESMMNQSQKYYALIGFIVGCINAGVFYVCQWILPLEVSLIVSFIVSVLLTGAFHEDGFADVCDSFGGGYGKEKILTIMKDSRIGAYGMIGMLLLIMLKFYTLKGIGLIDLPLIVFAIITGHTVSRFFSGLMIYSHAYVSDIDASKSKPMANKALPIKNSVWGILFCLLPFLLFQQWIYALVLPFAYLGKVYLGWYFKKHIGGYTGDCLGTVQQVTEVLFYIGILVLWKLQ